MPNMTRTRSDLEKIGFGLFGIWKALPDRLDYVLHGHGERASALVIARNALYAFCRGDEVLYIGKTARTIRARFTGYCTPSRTQRTNLRCNALIREALGRQETIAILGFSPSDQLQYGGFSINLAAGLEDALIAHFAPPWNGAGPGRPPVTETAEIEAEETSPDDPEIGLSQPGAAQGPDNGLGEVIFEVTLHETYFDGNIINPGIAFARYFGGHGEKVTVVFSDGGPPASKKIDRKNAGPGAVRLRGDASRTRQWLQKHFSPGEVLRIRILGPNSIEMIAPAPKS